MRTEGEMLSLILDTARRDDRIRAVVMNGSRVAPDAPRDPFQDFDIVYFVAETEPFRHNLEWIERFGELMIMQLPDEMGEQPSAHDGGYAYLMQFADGNRIDLSICPLAMIPRVVSDSLSAVLLDKDGRIPPLPPASDADYRPRPPDAKAFADCCNEFWWVSAYVAKGLWRREILYAKHVLDHYARDQLMKVLYWQVGQRTRFAASPGKYGKYLERYMDAAQWETLLRTYSDAEYGKTWDALMAACALFRETAQQVAAYHGFVYDQDEDRRVSAHLRHVRDLPADAKGIY